MEADLMTTDNYWPESSVTGRLSVQEAFDLLVTLATDLIAACRRPMAAGGTAFLPQAGSHYDAFWLRDFAYMVTGTAAAFQPSELIGACRLFLRAQRADGAMPDCIKLDGTPIYRPGFDTMGENPVVDGAPFAISIVWETYLQTGDRALLVDAAPQLIKALENMPRNERTGLVYIDPDREWDRCPYGFTDTVHKKGDLLFGSLLYIQAAQHLADLLQTVGRDGDADMWRAAAQQVAKKVRMYFWDKRVGLFRAASACCREHDVWGSAFAVYLNVATSGQLMSIARYFKTNYDDIVLNGQIRHLPAGVYWEQTDTPVDTYQNGAFWAVPAGWFAYAVDILDGDLADRLIVDLATDLATNGVYECITHGGDARVPDYAASAAAPIDGIRRLLARRQKRISMLVL